MIFLLQVAQQIIDWGHVGATAISSVGVLIGVYALRYFLPILKKKYEWALPLIALVGPMALAQLAELLLALFGHPVDFGPILELLKSGGVAVAIHQVYKQAKK